MASSAAAEPLLSGGVPDLELDGLTYASHGSRGAPIAGPAATAPRMTSLKKNKKTGGFPRDLSDYLAIENRKGYRK